MKNGSDSELLKKYQTLLAHASMGWWEWDFATDMMTIDEGFRKLYGFPDGVEAIEASKFMERMYPEDFEKAKEYGALAKTENHLADSLLRLTSLDGQLKYIRSRAQQIKNSRGQLVSLMGISWDVTAEMSLKIEKDKTDSQFQLIVSLVESSSDLFAFSNISGVPLYVNKAGQDIYGIESGKRNFIEYVAEKDRAFVQNVVLPQLRANKRWEGEITALNHYTKEEIPILLSIFSVKLGPTDKDIFYACSGSDLRKLKAIQSSLIIQSKMAALGEMAAEMAHEINNPLMIIQVKSQMMIEKLLKGAVDSEKLKADLQLIEKNSHRIQKIVHSSKAISRNAEMDPYTYVSILTLVDEALEIFQERFNKKKLRLELTVQEGISYDDLIEARGSEVLQVFVNLLNNAYDAVRNQPGGWVHFKINRVDSMYEIQVSDSGLKIPKEIANKMMDPFFTTKPTGQGTGLGLSLSKQIIENHAGQFYYESTSPDTTFVVRLQKRISKTPPVHT